MPKQPKRHFVTFHGAKHCIYISAVSNMLTDKGTQAGYLYKTASVNFEGGAGVGFVYI